MRYQRALIYFAATLFAAFAIIGLELHHLFFQPLPLSQHEAIVFRIDKSASAKTFARILYSQHLISSERLFILFIRAQGLSKHLKAGIYQVTPGESANQLLHRVITGKVLQETFRIIEGTNQQQVASNLAKAAYLNYQTSDWNNLTQNHPIAEGLLLADTYHYDAGSDGKALLAQAHASLEQYLTQCWQQRNSALPYKSPYELLIAASILEKEAAIPNERRLISSIIVNRLQHHMPLQMDPTVIYALGTSYTGKLTHQNMQTDSPYNTYRYRGLPPTPIAMVGKDSLEAASHPDTTNYLYFVAKGDGSHEFSETYEQQRQAIARYLRKH